MDDNESESMNWNKDIKPVLPDLLLLLISIIFFYWVNKIGIFESIKNHLDYKITITDIIAILTLFTLAAGVIFYTGIQGGRQKKYRLKEINLGLKYRLPILGATFIFSIFFAFVISMSSLFLWLIFSYVVILFILMLFSGYYWVENVHSKNVTLKMIALDESGCKKLETRGNLELFDATDTDYYFKDSNGNEHIIPRGQVQEIVYHNIENSKKNAEA